MLHVDQLYKKFPEAEKPSIDKLSFHFPSDKIVGLLGPNGAGKTTTISIISGLIKQFSGKVTVMGYDIQQHPDAIKSLVGIVPQQIALFSHLTCEENLIYFARLYNLTAAIRTERIVNYLHQFGLYEHRKKQIRHFSGGMKRRANIIASLLNNPKLLILDEPTAGVDVHSRNMILAFLKDYHAQGHSIMYTSHILEEAESLCHEILIIDEGKKIVQGSPVDLIASHQAANLEALFLKLTGYQLRD